MKAELFVQRVAKGIVIAGIVFLAAGHVYNHYQRYQQDKYFANGLYMQAVSDYHASASLWDSIPEPMDPKDPKTRHLIDLSYAYLVSGNNAVYHANYFVSLTSRQNVGGSLWNKGSNLVPPYNSDDPQTQAKVRKEVKELNTITTQMVDEHGRFSIDRLKQWEKTQQAGTK